MKAVIFDVKGTIAHFRRPDTTATQLTYPFITPTAAKGMIGAILGITDFTTRDKVGIQLLHPVKTTSQQLSMLKDGGDSFNRPTTVELLVNPFYRLYYVGNEHTEELVDKLQNRQSVYPTYLGIANALTFPELVDVVDEVRVINDQELIETKTVVPIHLIQDLIMDEDCYYSRAGGFMKKYLGHRTFEQSLSFLYERNGRLIKFSRKKMDSNEGEIVSIGGEEICLV